MPKKLLTEREVAELTGIALSTLRNYRSLGRGFKYVKLGRAVRYSAEDLDRYLESRTIDPEKRGQ